MNTRISQIETTVLAQYQSYRPTDKRVDEKRGQKDGKANLPAADAEIYPFHRAIVTEAQAVLRRYNDLLESVIKELDRQITSLWDDLDGRYQSARRDRQRLPERRGDPGTDPGAPLRQT